MKGSHLLIMHNHVPMTSKTRLTLRRPQLMIKNNHQEETATFLCLRAMGDRMAVVTGRSKSNLCPFPEMRCSWRQSRRAAAAPESGINFREAQSSAIVLDINVS